MSSLIRHILFSAVGTVLVLWTLLLPGYLLLLDWGVGEHSTLTFSNVGSYMQAPSTIAIYGLEQLVPPWLVQKAVLIAVVFALFFLPLRFYPWPLFRGIGYLSSIIAVCNPFVYERLLAGQWRVLVGYACLFPLFYYLVRFGQSPSSRTVIPIALTLVATGIWSIHFFVIGCLVTGLYLVLHVVTQMRTAPQKPIRTTLFPPLVLALLLGVASLYWLVPTALNQQVSIEPNFGTDDFSAFATVRDPLLGAVGSVVSLRGFWLEDEAWAEQFNLPDSSPLLFYPAALLLLLISILGWKQLVTVPAGRFYQQYVAILWSLAVVFAIGVSGYGVWMLNAWLLESVTLWSGFRDTQKWAGVIALGYALCFPIGIWHLTKRLPYRQALTAVSTGIIALALVPNLLFGLSGQIQPVWYPDGWQQVSDILEETEDCRAIFLPWHMYYGPSWNNQQLTINPGARAFACDVSFSRQVNLDGVPPQYTKQTDVMIDSLVTSLNASPDTSSATIAAFKAADITHIIHSLDFGGTDIYPYHFLTAPALELVYQDDSIQLYLITP